MKGRTKESNRVTVLQFRNGDISFHQEKKKGKIIREANLPNWAELKAHDYIDRGPRKNGEEDSWDYEGRLLTSCWLV